MKNFLHLSLVLIALTSMALPHKDKTANKLLKEVSKKYKDYKTLKSDFTVVTEAADPKTPKKTEKGSLQTKGNSFRLSFGGQEIFCNGRFIWTYTKETNECTKDKYNPNSGSGLNPAKIFTIWEKGFLYAADGTYKKGTVEIQKIKLTPTDKKKPYFLMDLEIDKNAKTVSSLRVSFKAGNKQTYNITSQTPNAAIADSVFEFNAAAYPGVEVVDLTK
jgi:outer membrane lipoprotein-sorting protein